MISIGDLRKAQEQFQSVKNELLADSLVGLDLSPPTTPLTPHTIRVIEKCLEILVVTADSNLDRYPDTGELK